MTKIKILLTPIILVSVLFCNAQTNISGIAKNYVDTVFYIKEPGGFENYTREWRDRMIKVMIDKYGHFKTTIPEKAINTWYIKTNKGNQFFDIIKGKEITLIADFSQSNPLKAINENANDFNFSSSSYATDSISKYSKDRDYFAKIRSKNIDTVLFYRKGLANYKLEILKKYNHFYSLSDVYYTWLRSKYNYEPYERTKVENINNEDSLDDVTISKIIENGIDDEYAALNNSDYNDLVDFYVRTKYLKQLKDKFSANGYFDYAVNSNLIKGSTRDVFLTRLMYGMRKSPDSLYTPIFKEYDKIVSNGKMKQAVIDARADYNDSFKPVEQDFTRAKSIEEIFKKYRGKVIYVDFWASWCVPCRQEMPNADILKNKLKGKNVVFLYFGYNDKDAAWKKARDQLNIQGEHYLLTEKMVKEADEVFGINGIPHYAIIDKDGNIVSKRADRPNDVYQQLLEQIEKQAK